jgi:hypothetical protein
VREEIRVVERALGDVFPVGTTRDTSHVVTPHGQLGGDHGTNAPGDTGYYKGRHDTPPLGVIDRDYGRDSRHQATSATTAGTPNTTKNIGSSSDTE